MERRMMPRSNLWLFVETAVMFALFSVADSVADPNDVQALQVLYSSLNTPSQLSGWNSRGGDPCGELWTGVTCQGSSVVSLQLSGLRLSGTLGYMLNNLASLTTLDLSNNNIQDSIPYQLPTNLTSLNLAGNNFSGVLPYSISSMTSLEYMNISRNHLSQTIGDIFVNHPALATLDLSFNNFTGDLPPSISSLTNLSILHLEKNKFSGSLEFLVGLPLTNLNVAGNDFSGLIPRDLFVIPNFEYSGNTFSNIPASPPPVYARPPTGRPHHTQPEIPSSVPSIHHHTKRRELAIGAIIGILLGALSAVVLLVLVLGFAKKRRSRKDVDESFSPGNLPVYSRDKDIQERRSRASAIFSDEHESVAIDTLSARSGSLRRVKCAVTTTHYTVATLQTATNCFAQENLVGEGSLGRVYRGVFLNGKVMAIKKIDNAAASLQDEEIFHEAISNMSRLRHPNIVALLGYCAEHGQRLLVHDFIGNGSLHDMLHFDDERNKKLTWNARVRIALGVARALEYLHEVCLPPIVHKNLKSANILLDEDLSPHLSDCGLAVLAPNSERQASSAQLVGSFGYSAPEFALSGIYTVKSDVYSFGIVMLELLTGRKPLDSSRVRSEQSLVRWATPQLHDIDALAKMVDPSLSGMYPARSLSRFADIIALCVQSEPEFRPLISEVVQSLVQLVQRVTTIKLRSSEESSFSFRPRDHESDSRSL